MRNQDQDAWSDIDRRMMQRALELAARGRGQVSPGPLVGCVITSDTEVIGEGYYVYEQVKHAEALALEQAGARARRATVYVSLEPHAHYGRTPPCTDKLIAAEVSRVVAAIKDPNPLVAGKGLTHLRAAGIQVDTGLFAPEAAQLNEKYMHFMNHARPFVHLKLASSLDGRIATRTGDAHWITGEAARARVQQLRHEYDAVLIGAGTAVADDPLLTDRTGHMRHRPLVRIVLDEKLHLSPESQLARTAQTAPVIVFTSEHAAMAENTAKLEAAGVEVIRDAAGGRNLTAVLDQLGSRRLSSVLVEGGGKIAGAFLDGGLVNKMSFFIAPMIIGGDAATVAVSGTGAAKISDAVRLTDVDITHHKLDIEITGYPLYKAPV